MRKKGNCEPGPNTSERHQSVFRLKSDSPQSGGILDEVRAEALVYGILVEFEIQPYAAWSQQTAVGTSLPQQAEEILNEILTKHYLKLCDALNSERRARGLKPLGDPAKLAKQKADFEKAYYGRLRHSEKGRMAVDLLRAWRGAQIAQQRGWCQVTDSGRIAELEPFLHAVRTLDVEFLKLLAQAAQMLDTQIRSSKDRTIVTRGTRDTYLDLCLLQYGVRIAGTPTHDPHELNEQLVSKFRTMSDKKVHDKLHELDIPHKHKPSGKASPNYGFAKGWAELKVRLTPE
jgi:hypothetical protein